MTLEQSRYSRKFFPSVSHNPTVSVFVQPSNAILWGQFFAASYEKSTTREAAANWPRSSLNSEIPPLLCSLPRWVTKHPLRASPSNSIAAPTSSTIRHPTRTSPWKCPKSSPQSSSRWRREIKNSRSSGHPPPANKIIIMIISLSNNIIRVTIVWLRRRTMAVSIFMTRFAKGTV